MYTFNSRKNTFLKAIKTSVYSLGFIIFTLLSCDDIPLSDPVVRDHFYKLYGTYDWDFSNAVIETGEGGLIWVGYNSENKENDQTDDDFNTYPYICKVSSDGMVEWDIKNLASYPQSIAHDVKLTQQNSEILVSISQKITDDSYNLHLLPISITGDFDTTLSTTISANRIVNASIIVRDDDSIRVIVQAENIHSNYTSTILYVYKVNGLNQLEKTFGYDLTDWLPEALEAVYLSDDQMIVACTSQDSYNSDETNIRVLNIIDKSILWEKLYGVSGVSESCSELKILDNKILISGNYSTTESTQIHVLSIDLDNQNGEFMRCNLSELTEPNCLSFDINSKNNYVFTGSFDTGIEKSDIFMIETTQAGEEVLYKHFGTSGEEIGENIGTKIISIDNTEDYFLMGQLEPINNTDVLIFKLDKEGSYLD